MFAIFRKWRRTLIGRTYKCFNLQGTRIKGAQYKAQTMKKTFWPHAAAGANRISCVKNSRKKRELHALARHETIGSLAKFIGIGIAKGSSMRTLIRILLVVLCLGAASVQAHAQGQVIDQESYPTPISVQNPYVDGLFLSDEQGEQLAQTFIPSLSSIDYIAMEFESKTTGPATVEVNLYEGSPSISFQTLIGTTAPVTMPAGFNNNQLVIGGTETFAFSTPITLTPGDEYYFEPVVVSGGAQWSFVTIVLDSYPNGRLYADGNPFVNVTDFWFQEGIAAVPEPGTLALIGFICLFAFIFRRHLKLPKLPVLVFAFVLFVLPVLSVNASQDSVVQATASAAGLTSVSATALPRTGTFWVTTIDTNSGLITLPPYPMLPTNMTDLPIFSITNDIFLVDDTGGKLSSSTETMSSDAATAAVREQSQSIANLIEMVETPPIPSTNGETGGTNVIIRSHLPKVMDTTNAWLEATNESPNLGLLLENAIGGDNYQLLSTTNLLVSRTDWDLGEILSGVSAGEDVFTPVPQTNMMMFYRVHHANPILEISQGQSAIEPNPTNSDPGQVGTFFINNEWNAATNDISIYFTISGTALNGHDYSNITDSVILPANRNQVQINIDPIADGLKPNQTIVFTLVQNTNYLIIPAASFATNVLIANPQVFPLINGDNVNPCPNSTQPIFLQAQDPRNLTLTYSINTWPTHGTLNTNSLQTGFLTYTSSNCFEGNDSFTYSVSDGQYSAGPATVTIDVQDLMFSTPLSVQTCRGTPISFTLLVGDSCGETLSSYELLSTPANGTLSNTPSTLNFTFTPNGTNFTGTNTFSYIAYSACGGDSTTNEVTIDVGDVNVNPNSQVFMSGTNQPLNITLTASDNSDTCTADTNNYVYAISSPPANGTVSGSGINRIYTPNHNFEGLDSFQFIVSDGVWTNSSASISIFVVAAPTLKTVCDPFGTAVQLSWSLDTNIFNMFNEGLNFTDFVLYRSTNSAQRGVPIYVDTNLGQTNYWDTNSVVGQAYYYTLNFESLESVGTNESPFSNQIVTSGQNPDDLIQANSYWEVATNLSQPSHVTRMQTPLSNLWPQQYPFLYPLPNTNWNSGTTWSNYTTLVIPTNTPLSQVKFSVAIDNEYSLTVNGTFVGTGTDNGLALWSSFQSFPTNVLHYGTNNVGVQIIDFDQPNYFSMVVTTNTCGW